jgi:hypothetical protein
MLLIPNSVFDVYLRAEFRIQGTHYLISVNSFKHKGRINQHSLTETAFHPPSLQRQCNMLPPRKIIKNYYIN